jgi:hypothetical protein
MLRCISGFKKPKLKVFARKENRTIMKTLFHSFILLSILSCVRPQDFNIPQIEMDDPEFSANSNISAVKNAYDQSGERIFTFDSNDSSIIEGYVVSSDEAGNFYKTLIIQDNYLNPTSGIEISIDLKAYFSKYNFGRKIFVKMAGLSIISIEWKYRIGYNLRNEVDEIPEALLNNFIIRSSEIKEIIPKSMELSEISEDLIGNYIKLENIQFKHDEIGKTFAGETFDAFNGDRVLIQCKDQITGILSTSTFSDFKSNIIPDKKGNLAAVLTKDFFGERYVLILNEPSKIEFMEINRCDPEFLNCGIVDPAENDLIFYEDFEELKNTDELVDLGWTNKNVNLGKEKFKKRTSLGNITMRISAFRTEENPLEVWLITPSINLDSSVNEILTFQTKATFDNGTILTTWVSSDYSENIKAAEWQQLDVEVSVGPENGFESNFVSSGKVSLDCLEGDVFIAFKYLGGDPGISTTYDIDEIKIIGN